MKLLCVFLILVSVLITCSFSETYKFEAQINSMRPKVIANHHRVLSRKYRVNGKKAFARRLQAKKAKKDKKEKKKKRRHGINALGRKVELKGKRQIEINKYPFKLNRCDQVVKLKAKFITDMGDYRKRSEGYFTLTSHYVNLYRDSGYKTLLRSILTSESPQVPTHIWGAKGCVLVHAPFTGDKDITVCLENRKQEKKLQKVFEFFRTCMPEKEGGAKKIDKKKLFLALKKCSGGKNLSPKELIKRLEAMKKKKKAYHFKSNFWHPSRDRLPGTPAPPKKKKHLMK